MPLTIKTTVLPPRPIGAYCEILQADGGTPPYIWSLEDGSLAPGLQLDPASGQIAGTATALGTTNFKVKVVDAAASPATASRILSLVIEQTSVRKRFFEALTSIALWKVAFLAAAAIVIAVTLTLLSLRGGLAWSTFSSGEMAAIGWGIAGAVLLFLIFLWASDSPKYFLALFCTAGAAAAGGYLTAVLITATGQEGEQLSRVQQLLTGALTGAIGVKILSLWDDLIKGDDPKIFHLQTFVPVIAAFVGFGLSLSAFYTIKSLTDLRVSITAEAGKLRPYMAQDPSQRLENGIDVTKENGTIQFSGAASSGKDISVSWKMLPVRPYAVLRGFLDQKEGQPGPGIDSKTGLLTVPTGDQLKAVLDKFKDDVEKSDALNWTVRATSQQDHSKYAEYRIRFCRDDNDCDPKVPLDGVAPSKSNDTPKTSAPSAQSHSGGSAVPHRSD